MLILLRKVTFSRISLEKAVETPLCALIFLKKHPKNAKYALCKIRKICEICEPSKLLVKSAKSAKSASAKKTARREICEPFKTPRKSAREHTRWKQPPTKLVHRRLSYKLAATYSPTLSCSTIGAHGLNCSVRNGKRCAPWL